MHFGAALRLLRLDSGLGLRDLARRVGVSGTYLSRVESGLDPAPTPTRLEHLARELGVPATMLVDLAHRISPFLVDYVDEVPDAGTLFLEIAQRRLGPRQLAEVRAFLDARFPLRSTAEPKALALTEILAAERIVLRLGCASIDDALDVAAGRFSSLGDGAEPSLAAALKRRERETSSAIGDGVAAPSAYMTGLSSDAAALVTLARPIAHPTPDREPLRVLFVLVGPPQSSTRRTRLAHVARLAARNVAEQLANLESPDAVLERLALLQA
jgi:PTS system nitrogen regulatory IIA component